MMKKLNISIVRCFTVWVIATQAFTSCDDSHDSVLPGGREEVAFSSGISGAGSPTRVIDQTWSTNDRVGICMYPAIGGTIANIDEYGGFKEYQPAKDGTEVSLNAVGTPLYYPVDNTKMHFVGFAPYQTPTTDKVTYTTVVDQRSSSDMEKMDFVWAINEVGHNYSNAPVSLTFTHRMSKLQMAVKRGSEVDETLFKNLSLTIDGIPTAVTYELSSGDVSSVATGNTASPVQCLKTADAENDVALFTAIVPPHSGRSHKLVFTLDKDNIYTYTLTAAVYEPNYAYFYNFTLSKYAVSSEGCEIDEWGEGTVSWAGAKSLHVAKKLSVEGKAATAELKVTTNAGVPVATLSSSKDAPGVAGADWITSVGKATAGSNNLYTIKFDVSAHSGVNSRTAYLHIVAGNLSTVVEVVQESGDIHIDPNYPLLPEKDANCIIVPPGGAQALIPVSRVDRFYDLAKDIATETATLSAKIGTTEELFAELIWADGSADGTANISSVLNPGAVIQKVGIIGSGPSARVYVQSGSMPGNAVVAVKRKNSDATYTILWSWHIWVTGYNPDLQANWKHYTNSATPTALTTTFMDRNLGALSNQPGTLDALGLLYQWGKKDPEVGGNAVNSTTCKRFYLNTSTNGTPSFSTPSSWTLGTGKVSIAISVQNPFKHYTYGSSPYDWSLTGGLAAALPPSLRWQQINGKSLDDPCPAGWMVPQGGDNSAATNVWLGLTHGVKGDDEGDRKFLLDTNNYGRYRSDMGWWPLAGYRYYNSSTLYGVGSYGYYWSATPYTNESSGYFLYFNIGTSGTPVNPSNNNSRSAGYSVRCVPEY